MNRKVVDARDLGAVVPSILDDYGLNPDEFRIYCRIARRAGNGKCFEGVPSMARACHMNVKTARKAIAVLSRAGLIHVDPNPGKTNDVVLMRESHWVHSSQLVEIRKNTTPTKSGSTKLGSTEFDPTHERITTPTKSGSTPYPREDHEGIPLRNPFKESHSHTTSQKSVSGFVALTNPEPAARVTDPLEHHPPVNSSKNAAVEDQGSAAAPPPVENSPRHLSSVEKCDRHFAQPQMPWGSYLNPEPAFLDYLLRIYLPKVPSNAGKDLNSGDARRWLNGAKFEEKRRDDALIEWDVFLEWRSRQSAPTVAAAVAEQPPTIATADTAQRIATLNGLLKAGRVESVQRAIATNPQWALALNGNEVVSA